MPSTRGRHVSANIYIGRNSTILRHCEALSAMVIRPSRDLSFLVKQSVPCLQYGVMVRIPVDDTFSS